MSRDKPYIYENREYFSAIRKVSWEEYAGDYGQAQLSEMQMPYLANNPWDDSYQSWEWNWPDFGFPDFDWDFPTGEPSDPCNVDPYCSTAAIVGPSVTFCGSLNQYSSVHVFISCPGDGLPAWAMLGRWSLEGGTEHIYAPTVNEEGYSASVIFNVFVDELAENGATYTVKWEGPGCDAEWETRVACTRCCEEFDLSAPTNKAPGETYYAYINPKCPGATCEITDSNSGCDLEEAGVSCSVDGTGGVVSIALPADFCGAFQFTVTAPEGDDPENPCPAYSQSWWFKIFPNPESPPHADWESVGTVSEPATTCDIGGAGCWYCEGAIESCADADDKRYYYVLYEVECCTGGSGCGAPGGNHPCGTSFDDACGGCEPFNPNGNWHIDGDKQEWICEC